MRIYKLLIFCNSPCTPGEWHALTKLMRHRAAEELIGCRAQQLVDARCNPHTNSLIQASKTIPQRFRTCLSSKITFQLPRRHSQFI